MMQNRFKKGLALMAALVMCITALSMQPAAKAEETAGKRWAKGVARAADTVDVFAPVGGQILDFDVKAGDVVHGESALFTLRPLQVLAVKDGVIRSLQGVVGDQAETIIAQYGALCFIDRTDVMWVRASIADAFDKPENRVLTPGETLRVYNGKSSDPEDTLGTVILVDGSHYVVEIPAGIFKLEDKVKLYRGDSDTYNAKERVGEGRVERAALIPVTGAGVIADILVTQGQKVSRGDALFTLDAASARHTEPAKTEITAPRGGVVSALYVQDGQQVMKDQLLLTIKPLDVLEFSVDVDELDIPSIQVGKTVRVKVDALGDTMITATVEKISPLGISVLDTTKYPVTLSIQSAPEGLLPGMHGTAYWE